MRTKQLNTGGKTRRAGTARRPTAYAAPNRTDPGPMPPVNVSPPTISGSDLIFSVLTRSTGVWLNSPTDFNQQWLRNGLPISGATGVNYATTVDDYGTNITVRVTAMNTAGQSTVDSTDSIGPIIQLAPVNQIPPLVSGSPIVGSELITSNGQWLNDPTIFTYQWRRNGIAIIGATTQTYTLVTDDIGASLSSEVLATNLAATTSQTSSNAIGPVVPPAPINTVQPIVTGGSQVNDTLTVSNGTWQNNPTSFAYEWRRAGAPISGATGNTYIATVDDVGSLLTCQVTASNAGGSTSAISSNSIGPIQQASVTRTTSFTPATLEAGLQQLAATAITISGFLRLDNGGRNGGPCAFTDNAFEVMEFTVQIIPAGGNLRIYTFGAVFFNDHTVRRNGVLLTPSLVDPNNPTNWFGWNIPLTGGGNTIRIEGADTNIAIDDFTVTGGTP